MYSHASQRQLVKLGVLFLFVFVTVWPFINPTAQAAPPAQSGVTPTFVYLPWIQNVPTPTLTPIRGTGTISGMVWYDRDGDAVLDPTESGLGIAGGIHIVLEDLAYNKISETLTNATNGTFSFASVTPGNYYVVEADPSGSQSTTANIVSVYVIANTTLQVYFGDQPTPLPRPTFTATATTTATTTPTPTPGTGTITGLVWDDQNANGSLDAAETRLAGVTVQLLDHSYNMVLPPVMTDATGRYSFNAIIPGSYFVVEIDLPGGYVSTTPNMVSLFVTANATFEISFGDHFAPTPTSTITPTPTPSTGVITGWVWNDADGDGFVDPAESAVSVPGGIHIVLENPAFGVIADTWTNPTNGDFTFTSVAPGNYYVIETDPAGYQSTTANIVGLFLTANTTVEVYFGDEVIHTATAVISGRVFRDANLDYAYNGSDSGVVGTITLRRSDMSLIATKNAEADGTFSFGPLAPDNYVLALDVPVGYATMPGSPSLVSVYAAPSSNVNVNFALYRLAADGAGTMTVSPATAAVGSATTLTFTFTSPADRDFVGGSQATIVVPPGWTLPQMSPGAGYVEVVSGSPACNAASASTAGSTITVDMECPAGTRFIVEYQNATPITPGPNPFTTSTMNDGGALVPIASSPEVWVY